MNTLKRLIVVLALAILIILVASFAVNLLGLLVDIITIAVLVFVIWWLAKKVDKP